MNKTRCLAALLTALISLPAAAADSGGTAGAITTFKYNTTHASYYSTWTLALTVAGETYYSGSFYCGFDLTANEVQVLHQLYTAGESITPRYVAGTTGNESKRCLVGWW